MVFFRSSPHAPPCCPSGTCRMCSQSGLRLSGLCPAQTETQARLLQRCLCCMSLVGVGCSCSMAYCPSPSPPPASAGCQATVPSVIRNAVTESQHFPLCQYLGEGILLSPSCPSFQPAAPSQPYKYLPRWRRALLPCLPGCPPRRLTRLSTFILSINPLNHTSSKSVRD